MHGERMAQRGKKSPDTDPSYKSMKADYYPVQRTMNLRSSSTEVDYYVLDVARNLSVQNHRLYRQGKTYSVKVDLNPGAASATFAVYALVDTWYVQKAWQMARAAYLKATADEREMMSKQKIARWEDFRVEAGLSGHGGGMLLPAPFSNGLASAVNTDGEFEVSRVTLKDGTTRTFTWANGTAAKYGILDEYDSSGNTDNAPSTLAGSNPYDGVGNVDEQQMDDLAGKGNAPPYNATAFNSRVWVRVGVLDSNAAHGKLSTGYFNAPCGLIAVQPSVSSTEITTQLTLTAQAGDYKGVKAMNMGV
jgi:hypothetical protein